MFRPRFLLLLPILLVTVCLFGQGRRPTSNPNINTAAPRLNSPNALSRLEIQLTGDDSRPLPVQVLIEIGGIGGGTYQQNFTDMEGRATFSVPNGHSYQIKISGAGIEPTQVSVELMQGQNFHHQMIPVKLTSEGKAKVAPGGIISAANLNLPPKARKEFEKGLDQMQGKKWADAKKHFEKAIQEYPNFDWAYNNIGVIDMQLKDEDGAQAAFTHAVEINGKNPDATRNLARFKLRTNDFEGARPLLETSLAALPGNPESLNLLAYVQFKTNQYDAALANAERVHRDDHDAYPLSHLIAATIRESKGDLVGAKKQYQTYLKEAPDAPQAQIAKEGLARLQTQAKN